MILKLKVGLVAGLLGAMVYSIVTLTLEYLYDNTSTKITIATKYTRLFPAVTICNQNPISYLKLKENQDPAALNLTKVVDNYLRVRNVNFTLEFFDSSRYLSEKVRNELYYEIKDFVYYCSLDRRTDSCGSSNFMKFYDFFHGNCFTFNSVLNKKQKPIRIKQAGKSPGLLIVFETDPQENIPGLSVTDGLLIAVHSPFIVPHNIGEIGLKIAPGASTDVIVHRKKRKRMVSSGDGCYFKYPQELIERFPSILYPGEGYDQLKCEMIANQFHVINSLDCCDIRMLGCIDHPDVPTCVDYEGLQEVYTNVTNKEFCKVGCIEVLYDASINTVPGPSTTYLEHTNFFPNKSTEEVKKSVGFLHVYFSTLNQEISEDIERFTATSLVSGIGGYAGLYVGLSFFSVFALFEATYKKYVTKSRKIEADEEKGLGEIDLTKSIDKKSVKVKAISKNHACNNLLKAMPTAILENLPNNFELSLSNNRIEVVTYKDILAIYRKNLTVNLEDNRVHCGCSFEQMVRYEIAGHAIRLTGICFSPRELSYMPFSSLKMKYFADC